MAGGQYVRVSAESGHVTFLLPEPARELAGVRLVQDMRIPGDRLDFSHGNMPRFC
jgi:hypothetical protein